jgi:hypothetical protein
MTYGEFILVQKRFEMNKLAVIYFIHKTLAEHVIIVPRGDYCDARP